MKDGNDTLPADFDDLSKHAPLLHRLRGKGDGFVVPENYFTESEELILAKTCFPGTDGFGVPENYFGETGELIVSGTSLPEKDGFVIPENYFETFTGRILALVKLIREKDEHDGFVVPGGYFEKLCDDIVSLASLHALKNNETFEVPEDYFSELDKMLPTHLALDNLKQDEGFDVPDGYFDELSNRIVARASVEHEVKENENAVPEGYFDTLADRIAARIAAEENTSATGVKERGRIIVLGEVIRRYARPAAVAASAAILLGVCAWFFLHNTSATNDEPLFAQHDSNMQQHVVPAPDTFSTPAQPEPKEMAVVKTQGHEKHKMHRVLNPTPEIAVQQVKKEDVISQADLLDETMIADYVSAKHPEVNVPDEKPFLTDDMKNYIMDNNVDLSDVLINNQ